MSKFKRLGRPLSCDLSVIREEDHSHSYDNFLRNSSLRQSFTKNSPLSSSLHDINFDSSLSSYGFNDDASMSIKSKQDISILSTLKEETYINQENRQSLLEYDLFSPQTIANNDNDEHSHGEDVNIMNLNDFNENSEMHFDYLNEENNLPRISSEIDTAIIPSEQPLLNSAYTEAFNTAVLSHVLSLESSYEQLHQNPVVREILSSAHAIIQDNDKEQSGNYKFNESVQRNSVSLTKRLSADGNELVRNFHSSNIKRPDLSPKPDHLHFSLSNHFKSCDDNSQWNTNDELKLTDKFEIHSFDSPTENNYLVKNKLKSSYSLPVSLESHESESELVKPSSFDFRRSSYIDQRNFEHSVMYEKSLNNYEPERSSLQHNLQLEDFPFVTIGIVPNKCKNDEFTVDDFGKVVYKENSKLHNSYSTPLLEENHRTKKKNIISNDSHCQATRGKKVKWFLKPFVKKTKTISISNSGKKALYSNNKSASMSNLSNLDDFKVSSISYQVGEFQCTFFDS